MTAYCTPPSTLRPLRRRRAYAVNNVDAALSSTPSKKDSVSKSRSMSNLACDQGGHSIIVINEK